MAVDFKEKHFENSDMNLKLEDHWSCIAHLTPREQSQLELLFLYPTRLLNVLNILVKYPENILKDFRVILRTKYYNFGSLREITHEPNQQELTLSHATLLPHALYNLTMFHENSSKGIGVMGSTRFCLQTDGQTDGRTNRRTDRRTLTRLLYTPNISIRG